MNLIILSATLSMFLPNVPGSVNPDVTQDNIHQTICVPGYSKTARPPVSYTNKIKLALYAKYNLTGGLKAWELDHDVSIELGGAPRDPDNLWMEPWDGPYGAHKKDACENRLHKMVCHGDISLKAAQYYISHNWIKSCSTLKP